MIDKNGKLYAFDINNMMDFVFDGVNERSTDSEITESYIQDEETKELVLINKNLREVKGNNNDSSKCTIKYDLLKTFIDILVNTDMSAPTTFGEDLIMNTLFNEDLIKEVNQ